MRLAQSGIILATLSFAALIVSITGRVASANVPVVALLKLAQGEFSNLIPAETALMKFAGDYRSEPSEFAAAGPSAIPDDPTNDPAHADEWSAQREVRAQLIRWLCVDPRARALIDPQGIRLLGARITGKLNLSDVKVPFPLVLRECSISQRITFERAVFPLLDLGGSYTGEIDGNGIVVHSDLGLNFLHASGEVSFRNSTVDGNFYAAGGRFRRSKVAPQEPLFSGLFNASGAALDVTSSQIHGVADLCCGIEADGAVVLAASTVGALVFTGGTFNNANNLAIAANVIRVDHAVFLGSSPFAHEGVRVNGFVTFLSAHVSEFFVQDATFFGGSWRFAWLRRQQNVDRNPAVAESKTGKRRVYESGGRDRRHPERRRKELACARKITPSRVYLHPIGGRRERWPVAS
jgi:hypothetical protein